MKHTQPQVILYRRKDNAFPRLCERNPGAKLNFFVRASNAGKGGGWMFGNEGIGQWAEVKRFRTDNPKETAQKVINTLRYLRERFPTGGIEIANLNEAYPDRGTIDRELALDLFDAFFYDEAITAEENAAQAVNDAQETLGKATNARASLRALRNAL